MSEQVLVAAPPMDGVTAVDPSQPSSSSKPASVIRTDRNEEFSLKVKAEFVLDQRPACLEALPAEEAKREDAPRRQDDRDNNNHRNRRGKQKQKGQKRPRDARTPNCDKVCLAVVKGDPCPYGETCKFSHDLKLFLKTRPEDIAIANTPLTCPNFEETGYCLFGALCRMGGCHLVKSTGENIQREGITTPPPIQNFLPKEILIQLRKRCYPFKCERKKTYTKKHESVNQAKLIKEENETKTDAKKQDKDTELEEAMTTNENLDTLEVQKDKVQEETTTSIPADVEVKKEGVEVRPPIQDPFRPSMAEFSNSTAFPSKTKKTLDFADKVYVAPLTTVGNLPFRRIMKRFGADITCGEMAVAGNLLEGKPSEWALLKRHPEEDVFGVQIASGYADQFTRVSEVIENHLDIDFLDMNLGCPLDIICNKGAGSSLMLRPNRLKGILAGVTGTLSCPVTVKMRTGWDMDRPFAHQLVSKIQSWEIDGIAAIMVHGRSRLQRYQKLADWEYVGNVYSCQSDDLPKLNIIGNGDLLSYTDYEEKVLSQKGLSTCAMLGRGALIKPWLPTEIKEKRHWDISATERLDILKDFVKFGLTHWGSDQQGVDNTRRFLLEWLSFLCRYVPVGLLEGGVPQKMNLRPPTHMCGRSDLETLMLSQHSLDWIKISEMLLGPIPEGFRFDPKHQAKSYG